MTGSGSQDQTPSSSVEIANLARAAGLAGRRYMDWTADDVVQRYVDDHEVDSEAWESAYEAGLLERRRTLEGWIERWTTAPTSYDVQETAALAVEGDWQGAPLRRVLIRPTLERYQLDRYGSGLYPAWSEDPREIDRRLAEAAARERARAEERAAQEAAGEAWLATATDEALDAARESDDGAPHGVTYTQVRHERRRRSEDREAAARRGDYERCHTLVLAHEVLVDDGAPATRGRWGTTPGRSPHVYYQVSIEDGWPTQDAGRAMVYAQPGNRGRECVGALEDVAGRLERGTLRGARLTDVPPAPVLQRFGHDRLADVQRFEADGRVVWIGRRTFAPDLLILDERGRVVRARAVVAAVTAHQRVGS